MSPLQGLFAAVSAVVLFLYGLHGFSDELQTVGGTALQSWLGRVTASKWRGFAAGALATAVVQSSSAVTALTTTLVDAGVISFRASLGVVLGSNVGTTATAWLVSFKLTGIGPFFIVLGATPVGRSDSSADDWQSRVLLRPDLLRVGPHFDGTQTTAEPTGVQGMDCPRTGPVAGRADRSRLHRAHPVEQCHDGCRHPARAARRHAARGRHPHGDWGQRGIDVDGAGREPWHAPDGARDGDFELSVQRRRRDRLLSVPETLCARDGESERGSRPRRRLGAPRLQPDGCHRVSHDAGPGRASSPSVVVC